MRRGHPWPTAGPGTHHPVRVVLFRASLLCKRTDAWLRLSSSLSQRPIRWVSPASLLARRLIGRSASCRAVGAAEWPVQCSAVERSSVGVLAVHEWRRVGATARPLAAAADHSASLRRSQRRCAAQRHLQCSSAISVRARCSLGPPQSSRSRRALPSLSARRDRRRRPVPLPVSTSARHPNQTIAPLRPRLTHPDVSMSMWVASQTTSSPHSTACPSPQIHIPPSAPHRPTSGRIIAAQPCRPAASSD